MKQFCIYTLVVYCLVVFSGCDYYVIDSHKEHVGFIKQKGFMNKEAFPPCFPEKIFPYYYGRNKAGFEHGLDSLKVYLTEEYNNFDNTSITGYITVRFLINCEGELGRFEVKSLGTDYKNKKLDFSLDALPEH